MRVLGLFSGVGGFELGLSLSGMDICGLCEIEGYCHPVLSRHFSGVPIFPDITKLSLSAGSYDVMCGGFPCQDISISGKNAGLRDGSQSSLWSHYHRLITEGCPKYAIIENVSALLGRGLEIILQDLAEIGYDATWTTFDSKYFGVPSRRRRVYIVAVRDGIPSDTDLFEFGERDSASHRSEIDSVNASFGWDFTSKREVEYPFAYFTRQRSDQFSEIGLSNTLTKRDYKDFTDLVLQEGKLRRVGVPERLLLQGFPIDWFDGCGLTRTQSYSSCGMTVPVVEHIGHLIQSFDSSL